MYNSWGVSTDLLKPAMAKTHLSSSRRSVSVRQLLAMFPDGVFKDIVPDAVKSLIRVPFPRLSGGSLGYNVLRYAALLLFLVNIRSWPMMWHSEYSSIALSGCFLTCLQARVFFPVLMLRLRWYMLQLRLLFKSKQVKRSAKAKWLGELRPIGLDPFEFVHVWKNWACRCL